MVGEGTGGAWSGDEANLTAEEKQRSVLRIWGGWTSESNFDRSFLSFRFHQRNMDKTTPRARDEQSMQRRTMFEVERSRTHSPNGGVWII